MTRNDTFLIIHSLTIVYVQYLDFLYLLFASNIFIFFFFKNIRIVYFK